MALFRTRTQTVVAAQWNGTNEEEIRELLGNRAAFPPIGFWVVDRPGGVALVSPPDFAAQFEPLL